MILNFVASALTTKEGTRITHSDSFEGLSDTDKDKVNELIKLINTNSIAQMKHLLRIAIKELDYRAALSTF